MHVYIDESGTFTIPTVRKPAISCVAALVIPDETHDTVIAGFEKLTQSWNLDAATVKGRLLDEVQICNLTLFLDQFDVILEVVAIEMSMQTVDGLYNHKLGQAEGLTKNLTPEHKPPLVESLRKLQARVTALSNQLYAQAVCTWDLVANVLSKATLYYVQRRPAELGNFYWFIDAKEKHKTSTYDDIWSSLVMPIIQSRSFRQPLIQLRGADYTAFERFCRVSPAPPDYLRPAVGDVAPFQYIDGNAVMREHFSISTPVDVPGLRIADILTNAMRRAMNGNLQARGWEALGRLTVQSERGSQVIHLIDLSGRPQPNFPRPPAYYRVIPHFEQTARQMLARDV